MERFYTYGLFLVVMALSVTAAPPRAVADRSGMVAIDGGSHIPFYALEDQKEIDVEPFLLDVYPVSNADFLEFVRSHPQWRKGGVPAIFARQGYLRHWEAALTLGDHADADPEQPVTRVSWFAANAYCESLEKRLPTEAEWEFAARAGQLGPDGPSEPGFTERILRWYSSPGSSRLGTIGQREANYWGIHDMHGLVWEWVMDFDANTDVARRGGEGKSTSFCGGAALEASDAGDYASFMRHAFRDSVKAVSTLRTLGFRCAADKEQE